VRALPLFNVVDRNESATVSWQARQVVPAVRLTVYAAIGMYGYAVNTVVTNRIYYPAAAWPTSHDDWK
jgi:hypothetical protein